MANGEWASEEASLKPYDKGYKRRFDRGFGLYTEGEKGPKSPFLAARQAPNRGYTGRLEEVTRPFFAVAD